MHFWRNIVVTTCLIGSFIFSFEAFGQKGKITGGVISFQSQEFEKAISQIKEGLKERDLLKPADIAKGNTYLAMSYIQVYETQYKEKEAAEKEKKQYVAKMPFKELVEGAYNAVGEVEKNDDERKKYIKELQDGGYYPVLANNFYKEGFISYKEKKYEEGKEMLSRAGQLFSKSGKAEFYDVYRMMAMCQMELKDADGAIASLEKGIGIFKQAKANDKDEIAPIMYILLAGQYADKQNFDKAAAILDEGKTKFPKNQDITNQELNMYIKNPQMREKALTKFEDAYNKNPENNDILMLYAQLMEKKDVDKALELYKKALIKDSKNNTANYNVGAIYINKGVDFVNKANDAKAGEDEKLKEKAKEQFKLALPYLETSHAENASDLYTLQGLVQVTLYLDMKDKLTEYTAKKKEAEAKKKN